MTVIFDKHANLADPREITLCLYLNRTMSPIIGYKTIIPPTVVSEKLHPGEPPAQIQIATVSGNIVGAWAEQYGTGTNDAKVWHKISAPAEAPAPLFVYDRTPLQQPEPIQDDEHKKHVTDITMKRGHVMYMMYAAAAAPSGYELASEPTQEFNNTFPMGPDSTVDAYSDTPVYPLNFVSCGTSTAQTLLGGYAGTATHLHNGIDSIQQQGVSESCVPPYHMLKLIRSNSIKPLIPKDAVLIFDGALPAGFTRYTAADGRYIRAGATIGETGGTTTRRVFCEGHTANWSGVGWGREGGAMLASLLTGHIHYFSGWSATINNTPPFIDVILARADNNINFIPAGAIMMFDEPPPTSDWDIINFNGRLLRGSATYGGTGGNATVTPANVSVTVGAASACYNGYAESGSGASRCAHPHTFVVNLGTIFTYPRCRPVIFARAKHNITVEGDQATVIRHDVYQTTGPFITRALVSATGRHLAIRNNGNAIGEIHCAYIATSEGTDRAWHGVSTNGGTTWASTQIDPSWSGSQLDTSLVIDALNRIHFTWCEDGDAGRRRIMYRRMNANNTWEAPEAVSTAGDTFYQIWPCIQVMNDGTSIAVVWSGQGWGTDTARLNIAYRERTTTWGTEARITSNAAAPFHYREPSIDFDSNNQPHITMSYREGDTSNMYYTRRISGVWQALEHINSDDNNRAGLGSNILIDMNGTIHITYVTPPPHTIIYKRRPLGMPWTAIETVSAEADIQYTTPQLQLMEGSKVACCYTKVSQKRHIAAYKIRNGSWGAENIIKSSSAMSYLYTQMAWSRLPLKDGIYQPMPQQGLIFILAATAHTSHTRGKLEFVALPTTVLGEIDTKITPTVFAAKRRGVINISKINGPLATPALIS